MELDVYSTMGRETTGARTVNAVSPTGTDDGSAERADKVDTGKEIKNARSIKASYI